MTFTPYDGGNLSVIIEAAFGGDPDDPDTWSFTDISSDLRIPRGGLSAAVTIRKGRSSESGRATPANVAFVLNNRAGAYTPGLATGARYPNIVRNLPIRVSVSGFGETPPYQRIVAFVDSYTLGWDNSTREAICAISASGRFRRLQQGGAGINSPMKSQILHYNPPYSYWPLEDGASATSGASAVGQEPALTENITFAADSTAAGSMPLPTMSTEALVRGTIPSYASTGIATYGVALNFPVAPAADVELLHIEDTGSASTWIVGITASTNTLTLKAYSAAGTLLVNASGALNATLPYGDWVWLSLDLREVAGDVTYDLEYIYTDGSGKSVTGTLSSQNIGIATSMRVQDVDAAPGLNGVGIGHLVFWNSGTSVAIFIGYALNYTLVDSTLERFDNLAIAAGLDNVSTVVSAATETALYMGATPIGTVLDGWRETEDVDGGIIHDGGTDGDITFVKRASMYNLDVDMTVTMANHELQNPFAPVLDDQRVITESVVSVRGGSSATFSTDIGEGVYHDEVTLNLLDATHAYEIASWRVARGTLGGMRYPRLTINLRRTPTLAQQWLACAIGSRIQVVVTHAQHPPDTIDLLLEGYTEQLAKRWWSVELVCSPYEPFIVAELDDTTTARLDTGGSVLHADWNGSAGTFTVDTSTGPLWTTDSGQYPMDLNLAGQRVRVSGCSGASNPQTFTVSTASVNGVSKTHSAGEAVNVWTPLRLAL